MDKIIIRELFLRCIIGINDFERDKKQDVLINLVLYADLKQAGVTDQFEDTVDYKKVKLSVIELVENSSYYLLEKLAESIARRCLEFSKIKKVQVTVDKPGALRYAKSVAIEITREQS